MKKGFTLVEVLAVIIVLAVVGLIVIPTINTIINKSEDDLYESQMKLILDQAKKWSYNNLKILPNYENESITITLYDLKKGGYLPLDIKNPKTEELLSNGLSIIITKKGNDYEFAIDEIISNTEYTENSPIITLKGNSVEYVEINSTYNEKGALAFDKDGAPLYRLSTDYFKEGKEIPEIDTSKKDTYTVVYSVTSSDLTTEVRRTVIVRDTISPVITVPNGTLLLTVSEAMNKDLKSDVVVLDNSGETITPTIEGFEVNLGEQIIVYKACDSSNNCSTANRLINIVE